MTWSAPSSRSRCILASLLAQAITCAPAILASITQPTPTPPLAPSTSTFSPACTWPMVCIIR
ncbi:Uncharacterised protein [Bordetella pertussis]|nr:Uncharacterised protein [Bordetella pertussis]